MGIGKTTCTRQSTFQHRFSVKLWVKVINKYLTGPYFIQGRTEGTSTFTSWKQHFLFYGSALHFTHQACNLLDTNYSKRWIGRGGPQRPGHHAPQIWHPSTLFCVAVLRKKSALQKCLIEIWSTACGRQLKVSDVNAGWCLKSRTQFGVVGRRAWRQRAVTSNSFKELNKMLSRTWYTLI
jgi:hypothetical protein